MLILAKIVFVFSWKGMMMSWSIKAWSIKDLLMAKTFHFLHGQSEKSQAGKMLGYLIGALDYSLPRRRS